MGALSSTTGIALVVPAFYVCAGILFYTAIIAAVLGLNRRDGAIYLAFAATSALSGCMSFAFASCYLAESVAGAVEAHRWVSVAGGFLVAALFAFVGLYTEAPRMARWYALALVAAAGHAIAALWLPYGTRFVSVTAFEYLHMPWGESLLHLRGEPGAANLALRVSALVFVGWAVYRLLELARRRSRRDAAFLAAYLVMLFAGSLQGGLVDLGLVRTFYWLPLALVGLALLMGVNLVIGLREQNRALATAARTDELTGLPNRRALREVLRRQLESGAGRHGAVLECDLDYFKVINDALGQEVGDAVLREVAKRLAACAQERALVARMGGNEFVLVSNALHDTEERARAGLDALAADVARVFATPFNIGERSLAVAASLGIATFHARATSATEVIARADTAVELAKRRGRNNLQVFVPEMQSEATERFRLVDGLRRAVERGELALNYQPLVDASGTVLGAEALLRWRSAELGEVSPAAFIPVAEETGLIHLLGEWSLRTGCERLAAWREGPGFPGYLAVNVSPWQLAHPDFVARLREVLAAHRVAAGTLTLEVTESAVLVDVNEAVAKLKEIRALGVNVALDDFGTGYSSLALVKDLPLDLIKIDRSFVRRLPEAANQHLVRVIVAIGDELAIGVVAEGVETVAERDALVALGCSRFQGYLFARPMPEPELLRWLATHAPPISPRPAPPLAAAAP